jgi:CarD family transcriptional regulator
MEQSFGVGDKAYYPVHGVAEVVALDTRDIGGQKTSVYVLKIMESGLKIIVPKTNADAVGLRNLIDNDEVEEVFAILKSKEVARDSQTWNRRHREYMEKIKTGSAFEIAEVLRDLCLLRSSKDLSFGEKRMLETARGLLVKEIALSQDSSEQEVNREIESIFAPAAA